MAVVPVTTYQRGVVIFTCGSDKNVLEDRKEEVEERHPRKQISTSYGLNCYQSRGKILGRFSPRSSLAHTVTTENQLMNQELSLCTRPDITSQKRPRFNALNAFNLKSLPDSCFLQVTGTIIGPSLPVVNRLLKPFFLPSGAEFVLKSFLRLVAWRCCMGACQHSPDRSACDVRRYARRYAASSVIEALLVGGATSCTEQLPV